MSQKNPNYRWFVVAIFFFFMLLHQTDKLMIGSLQVQISETFGLNDFQWGLVNSGALAVATVLYPLWGYLYDIMRAPNCSRWRRSFGARPHG